MPPAYNHLQQRAPVPAPSQFHPSIRVKASQLDSVILKMIALKKEDRYQTMQQLKNVLIPIYNNIP
jgi:hypothetical protein